MMRSNYLHRPHVVDRVYHPDQPRQVVADVIHLRVDISRHAHLGAHQLVDLCQQEWMDFAVLAQDGEL
jgi:hypothetical protein